MTNFSIGSSLLLGEEEESELFELHSSTIAIAIVVQDLLLFGVDLVVA